MGIIIDIVLVAIVVLSVFLGYRKGLVKLATKLFAGIIAIIVTVILYRPIAGMIINNTSIDEKLQNLIMQNTTSFIDENLQEQNIVTGKIKAQMKDEILPNEADNIARSIVYALTAIILFVVVKIALSIVISLMDFVASLPLLKQFNEVGGIVYGIIRGAVIVCICVLLIGAFIKVKPQSSLSNSIQDSLLTKVIYKSIVKF